jgi:hypothetical protein
MRATVAKIVNADSRSKGFYLGSWFGGHPPTIPTHTAIN